MAIIRKNEEYVKIELDKYVINNGQLSVPLIFYKSKEHRQFEKLHGNNIDNFIKKATAYIDNIQTDISNYLKTICPNAETSEEYMQYASIITNDLHLQQLCSQLKSINEEYYMIKSILAGESIQVGILTNLEIFKSLGFEESWLYNPIIIVRRAVINVGDVGNMHLDGQTIYNLLKNKIPNTSDDL